MSEKKEDRKFSMTVHYDMVGENATSRRMYNLAIGLTLVVGCVINWLMAYKLTPLVTSIQPHWLVLVLYFAGTIGFSILINKTESPVAGFLGFCGLAVSMGLLLTYYIGMFTGQTVEQAFLLSVIALGTMTVLGTLFPDLFLRMGRALGIALLLALVVSVVGGLVFKQSMEWMDYAVIVIFLGYTGYDWAVAQRRPTTVPNAIRSACALYMDLVNIFVRLLSIMGRSRD